MTKQQAIWTLIDCRRLLIDGLVSVQAEEITEAFDMAIEALKAKPSAEAVQGEWIDYVGKDLGIEGQWLRDDGKTVFVQCDQCDSTFVRNLMTHMNFCPNCGARMTKGGENE